MTSVSHVASRFRLSNSEYIHSLSLLCFYLKKVGHGSALCPPYYMPCFVDGAGSEGIFYH